MDFQIARSCVYFSKSIGDICNSIHLQIGLLSKYFNLCLPLERVPSSVPVIHKFSKPCLLITSQKSEFLSELL